MSPLFGLGSPLGREGKKRGGRGVKTFTGRRKVLELWPLPRKERRLGAP